MPAIGEFSCFRRIEKQEYPGVLTLFKNLIEFSSVDPAVAWKYPLEAYTAHRQHPKLPMLQLRFSKNENSNLLEDITLVFKDTVSGAAQFDVLKRFVTLFTTAFQVIKRPSAPVVKSVATLESPAAQPTSSATNVSSPAASAPPNAISPTSADASCTITKPNLKSFGLGVAISKEEQEDRERILREDKQLQRAYGMLVRKGYLTEEQFWHDYKVELHSQKSLPAGVESHQNFLGVPPPVGVYAEGSNGQALLKTAFSEWHTQQILTEFPALRDVYATNVPEKMSHEEFWNRFFQSRFFHQMVGLEPPTTADSSLIPGLDEANFIPKLEAPRVASIVSPAIDLIASDGITRPGIGTILGPGGLVGDLSKRPSRNPARFIVDRLNRHSVTVLQRAGQIADTSTESSGHLSETILEDLLDKSPPKVFPIELKNKTCQSSAEDQKFLQDCDLRHKEEFRAALVSRLKQWRRQSGLEEDLPKNEAKFLFLLNTKLIQRRLQLEDQAKLQELFNAEEVQALVSQVAEHQTRLCELLHAFWTSPVSQERQRRLANAIEAMLEELKRAMVQTHVPTLSNKLNSLINARALYQPLIEAGKIALERSENVRQAMERRNIRETEACASR